jgi:FkbM family methyltransferase
LRPARLDISLRNAARPASPPEAPPTEIEPMAETADAAESEPAAEAAPPEPSPAPPRRRGPIRRALSPFQGLAHYARAFLTAPLEAPLNVLVHRLGALEARLAVLESVAADIRADTAQANHGLLLAAARSDNLEARLDTLGARLETAQREAVGEMWVGVAGRLNELELKLRPILAFGEDAFAVRLGDGYILAPRDQPILLSMLADATTGGLEPGTREVLRAILSPGMTAADIGANIGLLTLAMGRAVGPAGKLWSFEPEDVYRDLLARSLHLNGLAWVELRSEAVGAKAGTRTFNVSAIPGHSSLFELPAEEKPRKVKVKAVRLDDVVPPGVALDLCKIDVEGAELEVLAGMERVLAESPEIALVAEYGPSHLARVGIAPADWFAAFAAKGFEAFAIDEAERRCYAAGPAELAGLLSVNVVFVRRGGRASRRLPR